MSGLTQLERCDGPECPKCGCEDTHCYVGRRRWGGAEYVQFICGHCGAIFHPGPRWQAEQKTNSKPDDVSAGGAVIYRPVRCPKCGSVKTKVTSTRRPVRHHKCKDCGECFKSVEAK